MNKIIEFANYFLLIMLVMQTLLCAYDCLIGIFCSTIVKDKFRAGEKFFEFICIFILFILEFKFWDDINNNIYSLSSAIFMIIVLIWLKVFDELLYKNLLKELKDKNITILKRK